MGGEAVDELSLFGGSQYALRQVSNQVAVCGCNDGSVYWLFCAQRWRPDSGLTLGRTRLGELAQIWLARRQ